MQDRVSQGTDLVLLREQQHFLILKTSGARYSNHTVLEVRQYFLVDGNVDAEFLNSETLVISDMSALDVQMLAILTEICAEVHEICSALYHTVGAVDCSTASTAHLYHAGQHTVPV